MDQRPYTLLLVDDQTIFLDGMESLLERIHEVGIIGKARNGQEGLQLAIALKPDVVLMDINMPHMDGIEASKRIRKACPRTQVLVLSMYGNREFLHELLKVGVGGYLLKSTGKAQLSEAIRTVAEGGRYIAQELRDLADTPDRHAERDDGPQYGPLTKREVDIVKLIMQQRTTQEIAEQLFLSTSTVETHRRNIFHEIDCRNLAGLVKYAMERGWG